MSRPTCTRRYSRVPKPDGLVRPSFNKTGEFIRLGGQKLVENSQELRKIEDDLWVLPEFITKEEEARLIEEINPLFRKKRYIDTHWDGVITGYKEIEKSFWVRIASWSECSAPPPDLGCSNVYVTWLSISY